MWNKKIQSEELGKKKKKIFLNQNGGSKAISVYTEHDGNKENPKNSTKV